MSSEQQEYSEQLFAGEQFAQAREALGLSVEQISQELNLSVKILRAIESGTPQTLPNPVFVRGYIRNYAKRLGLDPDLSARQFEAIPGVNLTPTSVRSAVSMEARDQSRSPFMRGLTWVLVLAVIAAAVWWSGEQYGLFEQFTEAPPERSADAVVVIEHESTSPAVTGQVPSFEAPVQQDTQPLSSEPTQVLPPEPSVVLTEEAVEVLPQTQASEQPATQADAVSLPQAEVAAAPASDPDLTSSGLMVSFIDDCWVQIRDAEGTSLFAGVARAGSDLDLQGVEPLSVVIGRVDAVGNITYKGESIDLQSMSNRNVARFNLPLR